MLDLLEPLRQMRAGTGQNEIRRNTRRSKLVLTRLRRLAEQQGWLNSDALLPDERTLSDLWYGKNKERPHTLDASRSVIKEWLDKDYRKRTIFRLLRDRIGEHCPPERTVAYYIATRFPKQIDPVMTREKEPSVADVDFGYLGLVYDARERKTHRAYVFILRLRYSRRAYRAVVLSQNIATVAEHFALAFEHLGGVARIVNLDNFKAAITKAARYDFHVSRMMHEIAVHYGFLVNACLPRTPEHKGGVEKEMDFVKGDFWPRYVEEEKDRGHDVPHFQGVTNALLAWEEKVADIRIIGGVGEQPRVLFEEERSVLKPLPASRFEPFTHKRCTVSEQYLVQFECAYYSVPYEHIGKEVDVVGTSKLVRIFLANSAIAVHARAEKKWKIEKKDEHGPKDKVEYMSRSHATAIAVATKIGAATVHLIRTTLAEEGVERARNAWGILGLAKHYGAARLERACERANLGGYTLYNDVRDILRNNIDANPPDVAVTPTGQYEFNFQTPSAAYHDAIKNMEVPL